MKMNSRAITPVAIGLMFIFAAISYAADDFRTIDTKQLQSMTMDNAYSLEGGRGLKFIIVDVRTYRRDGARCEGEGGPALTIMMRYSRTIQEEQS